MFDILSDELNHMDERSQSRRKSIGKAVSLDDPISSLALGDFSVLSQDEKLSNIIKILQDEHLACVILENNDKISGIFSERDILNKIVGFRLDLKKESVLKYMTANPETLHMKDSIAFALNKMTAGGFRHVPIVDNNQKTVAVVCITDIINHLGEYYFNEIFNLPPKPTHRQDEAEGA